MGIESGLAFIAYSSLSTITGKSLPFIGSDIVKKHTAEIEPIKTLGSDLVGAGTTHDRTLIWNRNPCSYRR